ncbi:hypothetical protein C4D60_Mb10t25560 [Musa balbisiana]|uniref:Uncharacterized protein n=1 Tax=Musa balbisiana TaxID=52838 RepID=A0A4S8IZT7_MUSBA|nr:hypothetical protein C4D60_Mb10t25560 [Musa balbisiana]
MGSPWRCIGRACTRGDADGARHVLAASTGIPERPIRTGSDVDAEASIPHPEREAERLTAVRIDRGASTVPIASSGNSRTL